MLKRETSPYQLMSEKRVKVEKTDALAPSCASLQSMNLSPENFKGGSLDLRMKQESSPKAICMSLKSEDPPEQFKQELIPDNSSDLTACLLTKDDYKCTVCAEVLKDPVSIPCGHSYCRQCISSYWAQPNHAGLYACPQCSHTYSSCPALYTNSALAEVVQKLQHFSSVLPAQCCAGPGDVACDFCTGRKLRAVKSCLTCMASYCESHVRQHYTVLALQRHMLVEPEDQEEKPKDQCNIKTEGKEQQSSAQSPGVDPRIDQGTPYERAKMKKKASPVQTIPEKRVKLERSDSPAPSCTSLKSMEQPQNFSAFTPEHSGVKLERSGSPAPSCSSLKSMEQPQNFSTVTPQHSGVKLERSDSPAPSCLSLKSTEQPQNFKGELTPDSRVKLERSNSPALSCLSLKSMEQPQNFKGELTPDSRVKLERSDSPPPSCLSLKSMEHPQNFRAFTQQHSGVKVERSDTPAFSCLSLKSMEQPQNFKGELIPDIRVKLERSDSPEPSCMSLKSMEQPQNFGAFTPQHSGMLLIVDHFRCSVCAEVLKDPVSIPCGHSYCRQCISSYWAQPNHAGLYACPQCSHTYSSCPALYTNSALAQVVHKLQHFSPSLPAQCCAGPGDVACDFCTGKKLRAVKSCLTCMASYCETHVKDHYTVPVLRTHTLAECAHYDQKPLDIKCDIKTEELKQRQDEPGNQEPIINKLLDTKTENMEHGKDTKRGAPAVQTQTEHQQQTTEDPGKQPQPSAPQDQLSAQDNVENPENNSEKEDKSLDGNGQDSAPEKDPKESRRLSIQRCIQSLVHACQCRNANCSLPSCQKMKRVVQHIKGCKRKTNGGCPVCKHFIALCCYHAKHCQEAKCPVPFCLNIKHKLRQQKLQHRFQQAQLMRRRMASMQRSGQTTVPGPEGSTSPNTPISTTQPVMPQISKSLDNTLGHQPVNGCGSEAPQQQHPNILPRPVSTSVSVSVLQELLRVLRSPSSPSQHQEVLNILRANPPLVAALIKQRKLKLSKTMN